MDRAQTSVEHLRSADVKEQASNMHKLLPPSTRSTLWRRPVRPAHAVQVREAVPHAGLFGLNIEAAGAQPAPPVEHHELPCAFSGSTRKLTGLAFLHLSQVSLRKVTIRKM
jgi:hypothetical protein